MNELLNKTDNTQKVESAPVEASEDKLQQMTLELSEIDQLLAELKRVKTDGIFTRLYNWFFGNKNQILKIIEDTRCNDKKEFDTALLKLIKKIIINRKIYYYLHKSSYGEDYYMNYGYDEAKIYFDGILCKFKNYQVKGFLQDKNTYTYQFLTNNNCRIYVDVAKYNRNSANNMFMSDQIFQFAPGKHNAVSNG